jgi:hypothetical protein
LFSASSHYGPISPPEAEKRYLALRGAGGSVCVRTNPHPDAGHDVYATLGEGTDAAPVAPAAAQEGV